MKFANFGLFFFAARNCGNPQFAKRARYLRPPHPKSILLSRTSRLRRSAASVTAIDQSNKHASPLSSNAREPCWPNTNSALDMNRAASIASVRANVMSRVAAPISPRYGVLAAERSTAERGGMEPSGETSVAAPKAFPTGLPMVAASVGPVRPCDVSRGTRLIYRYPR